MTFPHSTHGPSGPQPGTQEACVCALRGRELGAGVRACSLRGKGGDSAVPFINPGSQAQVSQRTNQTRSDRHAWRPGVSVGGQMIPPKGSCPQSFIYEDVGLWSTPVCDKKLIYLKWSWVGSIPRYWRSILFKSYLRKLHFEHKPQRISTDRSQWLWAHKQNLKHPWNMASWDSISRNRPYRTYGTGITGCNNLQSVLKSF